MLSSVVGYGDDHIPSARICDVPRDLLNGRSLRLVLAAASQQRRGRRDQCEEKGSYCHRSHDKSLTKRSSDGVAQREKIPRCRSTQLYCEFSPLSERHSECLTRALREALEDGDGSSVMTWRQVVHMCECAVA